MNVAYFISSHGFGHAARSSAVIRKLLEVGHAVFLYTTTPEWFFKNSLPEGRYVYTEWQTDVGLIQKNPFEEDIPKTIQALQQTFPPQPHNFQGLITTLKKQAINLVIADISAVGLLAAEALSCDSILIENFTWDWIYEQYLQTYPALSPWVDYFSEVYQKATHHFVTEPSCKVLPASQRIAPIARQARTPRQVLRKQLGIQPDQKMVLITMGGIAIDFKEDMFENIAANLKIVFPVGNLLQERKQNNYHLLPHNHSYFHPDLVQAADLVIAKVGYSTIAEAYHAGRPLLYIPRETFPESLQLEEFIRTVMHGAPLTEIELFSGNWQEKALQLMATQTNALDLKVNGADQILAFIQENYIKLDRDSSNQG